MTGPADPPTADRSAAPPPAATTSTTSTSTAPTAPEWLAGFAAALGGEPPDDDTIATLLDLAGVAAHASERIAAPIACYLAGRLGVDPAEALARARGVGEARP